MMLGLLPAEGRGESGSQTAVPESRVLDVPSGHGLSELDRRSYLRQGGYFQK